MTNLVLHTDISEMANYAEDKLFHKILYNASHVLSMLLPEHRNELYVCEALICKKALSVKITGPLSPKALKCKNLVGPYL